MRHASKVIMVGLAGGIAALAGCGQDGAPLPDPGRELSGLTVIEAVQLGAEQGCRDVAGRVQGSVELSPIEGAEDLVLVLEDGYPLCIDTMPNVGEALKLIEASYQGDVGSEDRGSTPTDDVSLRSMDTSGGQTPDRETDPNPQPALGSSVAKIVTVSTTTPAPAPPANGTPPTPPAPRADD